MRLALSILALLAAGSVQGANCTIDLKGDDMMKFDQKSVTVSSTCETVTINLQHVGKLPAQTMGHNVVVSPTASYQAAAQDGMKAGLANNYVPPNDDRVIASTKIIGGGETTSVSFPGSKLKAGEDYTFYCSFPGHWAIMNGKVVVE